MKLKVLSFFRALTFFPEVKVPSGRSHELGGCSPTLAMAKARAADGAAMDAAKAAGLAAGAALGLVPAGALIALRVWITSGRNR